MWSGFGRVKKRNGGKQRGQGSQKRQAKSSQPVLARVTTQRHVKPQTRPMPRAIVAVAPRYGHDERLSLALLVAPFLIVAASLAGQQTLRTASAMRPDPIVITSVDLRPITPPPAIIVPERAPVPILPTVPAFPEVVVPPAPPRAPVVVTPVTPPNLPRVLVRRAPATPLPPLSPLIEKPQIASPTGRAPEAPVISEPARPAEGPRTAALDPALRPETAPPKSVPPAPLPQPLPEIVAPAVPVSPELCHARPDLLTRAQTLRATVAAMPDTPSGFGLALAAAARAQLDDLVIYNARYARIDFPNGDVAPLFGVCTDVVVRAYRAMGIDLQQLVQATRSGRGDVHIDHRRVDVLRRFLARHGEVLAISDLAEDYQPGDIVTYYRPQNRSSTTHIAIVTDLIAPSGRPLILHNRGWGPQLEDGLFVDKITGHYRFSGLTAPVAIREAEKGPEHLATLALATPASRFATRRIVAAKSRAVAVTRP